MTSIQNIPDVSNPDSLVEPACAAAIKGARDWLAANGQVADEDTLRELITRRVEDRWVSAVTEAQDAQDAGLTRIALPLFLQAMRAAGMEAAADTVSFMHDMATHQW